MVREQDTGNKVVSKNKSCYQPQKKKSGKTAYESAASSGRLEGEELWDGVCKYVLRRGGSCLITLKGI